MDSLHESSPLLRASRSIRNAEHRNRSSPQVLLLALPSLLLLFSLVLLLQWNYNGLFALYGSREIPSDALSSPFLSEALPLFVRAGVYLGSLHTLVLLPLLTN